MSYSGYRTRGLGDSPEEDLRAESTVRQSDHGQDWLMIGVRSPEYRTMTRRMNVLGLPIGLAPGTPGKREYAKADMGTGLGLWAAWLRFGRVQQWWLGELVRNEVLTDSLVVDWGRRLRVHPQLLDAMTNGGRFGAGSLWAKSSDGYVHFMGGTSGSQRDRTLDDVVKRLIQAGYLPALREGETISQRTDSYFGANNEALGGSAGPFLGDGSPHTGLRLAFDDLVAERRRSSSAPDPGTWPTGVDFGATAGREIRIHPLLLKALFETTLPGEVRMVRARAARLNMKKIIGGFPRVGGGR